MTILPNWGAVLRYSWSLRFIVLSLALTVIEAVLPFLNLPIPAGVFAVLSALAGGAAFFARLVAQKKISEVKEPSDG